MNKLVANLENHVTLTAEVKLTALIVQSSHCELCVREDGMSWLRRLTKL